MHYVNFDLMIDPGGDGYRARARTGDSPAAVGVPLPAFAGSFSGDAGRLAGAPADQAYYQDLGIRLFRSVFVGDIARAYADCVARQRRAANQGVCIRFCINPPEVQALPWEFLFHPDEREYIGTSIETPILRYLDVRKPIHDFLVSLPLDMLVVAPAAARAAAGRALKSDDEIERLRKLAQGAAGIVRLTVIDREATYERVSAELIRRRYQVVHFIGHGKFQSDRAFLQFDRPGGGLDLIDEERFSGIFVNQPSIKLVFLNACETAMTSTAHAIHGLAPRLVAAGVPAVIAMQFEVGDVEAITFAETFYLSLFQGADRGRVDVAMCHARKHLEVEYPDQREIGTPVLYLRAPAGILFDADGSRSGLGPLVRGADRDRLAAASRTLEHNLALRRDETGAGEPEQLRERNELTGLRRVAGMHNLVLAGIASLLAVCLGVSAPFVNWAADSYAKGAVDWISPPELHPDIMLVSIDTDTFKKLNLAYDEKRLPPDFRLRHALAIERLSAAGARVVAFDFFYTSASPHDEKLTSAIRAARKAGTSVVIASDAYQDGVPQMIPSLREAVSAWGFGCSAADAYGYVSTAPLAVRPLAAAEFRASLPLAAYSPEHELVSVDFEDRVLLMKPRAGGRIAGADWVKVRFIESRPARQSGCGAIEKGALVAKFIVDMLPAAQLRARRVAYEDVAGDAPTADLSRFAGKTVIVGRERLTDDRAGAVAAIHRGERLQGMIPVFEGGRVEAYTPIEWHASVLSMLMRQQLVGRVAGSAAAVVALAFGFAAAVLGYVVGTRRIGILPDVAAVLLLLLGCVAVACVAYVAYSNLLNVAWCGVGCIVGYTMARIIRLNWFKL